MNLMEPEDWRVNLYSCILPAIYASIHLTAWNFEFPTTTEHLIWKIACLTISSAMPTIYVLLAYMSWEDGRESQWYAGRVALWVAAAVLVLLIILYGLSRVFIVVESFISLRNVPVSIYWTPSWLQMIPHV